MARHAFFWFTTITILCSDTYAKDPRLTVCTYNINWGNPHPAKTIALLKTINADFVALQETNAESKAFLIKHLKKSYPHMVFTKYSHLGAGGYGFLSKYKIEGATCEKPKRGLFGSYRCKVVVGGTTISILSTHLTPALPRHGADAMELANVLFKAETARTKEIRHLVTKKPETPTIILGDFNSSSCQFAARHLQGLAYTDSFAAVTKEPDKQPSWGWAYKGVKLQYRIDYVFHSSHFKTLKSAIHAKGPSDHYPVVSTLKVLPAK